MSVTKKILLILFIAFILIQFIRPEKNLSAGQAPDDIFNRYPATGNVKHLVITACYDCHGNNTNYPWYATIQPVAWWLTRHVKQGKRHLNFNEFAKYTAKRADHKLEEVIDEVNEDKMPLKSYTFIHRNAELTKAQRKEITDWAAATRKIIMADSLSKASQL
ncbi:MAG: heme-binding domain-containing protein [Daejeonella sp.]